MRSRRSTKKIASNKANSSFKIFLQKYITNSQALPFVVTISALGILFVLIRMKGIENDYRQNELTKMVREAQLDNKELKAERARMLSIKKLRGIATKYQLKEPDEKQVIVIP
jgi:hypothetical protein